MAVCSFKPPFEDDAHCSHVSAPVYGLCFSVYSFVHSVSVRVFVHVCVPILFVCLCLLVVVCVSVC